MALEKKNGQGVSPRLAQALAKGDVAALRDILRAPTPQERAQLEQRLGAAQVDALQQNSRRARSKDKRGRVVVINGIMGAKLDVVDLASGDDDSVWVNYWRLLHGRIADLELDLQSRPKKNGVSVRVAGLFPEYLPLVAELDRHWHVLPFAFDWRQDIDASALKLGEEIERWGRGEPVHIVAHSMGGLVARRFCSMVPTLWQAMQDPEGRGRGGRLVMLGTPNRGSFAIPLVFSGLEPVVKKLAMLDLSHDLDQLLAILATFPGCYQMLPVPDAALNDDRAKLLERAAWGKLRVLEPHLQLAQRFQRALSRVIDPERLVYVAGYDRETPYRIQVQAPGKFRFLTTLHGDGRVPHDTGLLEDVRSLWVAEAHGDLARNAAVLEGIHELLERGTTDSLESARPAPKRAAPSGKWTEADALMGVEPEFVALAEKAQRGSTRGSPNLTPEEEARIDALLARQLVGGASEAEAATPTPVEDAPSATASSSKTARGKKPRSAAPSLAVEVVWGDITQVDGDVFSVGHYNNVLPQNAERALDRVVSPPGATDERMVLREQTRLGVLSGDVGKVSFFPWSDPKQRKFVAVAGMGYLGKFGRNELRRLARSLGQAVATLPGSNVLCTVLIGSGAGNLPLKDALVNLLWGIADAMADLPAGTVMTKLRIVEFKRRNAELILRELLLFTGHDSELRKRLALKVRTELVRDASARLSSEEVCGDALGALLSATRAPGTAAQRRATAAALRRLVGRAASAAQVKEAADKFIGDGKQAAQKLPRRLRVEVEDERTNASAAGEPSTRLACIDDEGETRVSLLTRDAVIPERVIRVDRALIDELIVSLTDPARQSVARLGALLGNMLLPRDFRDSVRNADSMVVEVDRQTARVQWEMLSVASTSEDHGVPLALQAAFARQLRTGYSPAPSVDTTAGRKPRMLLIGDPGDPREGDDLPGARREALAIHAELHERVDIEALIGAPSVARKGELRPFKPAARLDVLERLMRGGYDLLHYCGHGDFDPDDPTRAGWVFEGGLLTAFELERVDLAPRLVVANACLSGLTSNRGAKGAARDEAGLLPSLADEFFHRGVRNYIGTAWEVSDEGAIVFAKTLYGKLIPGLGAPGEPLGTALHAARVELHRRADEYDALWAAYQHYGDPTFQLVSRR